MLKDALKEVEGDSSALGIESVIKQKSNVGKELTEVVRRESAKSEEDIYQEVFIDEVNEELLRNVQKCEGEVIVLLARQERLKSFANIWKTANLDFYNTQTSKDLKLRK